MGKHEIEKALNAFKTVDLSQASIALFKSVGLESSKQMPLETKSYSEFFSQFVQNSQSFRPEKALTQDWIYIDFLFQITTDELRQYVDISKNVIDHSANSYLFFCLELKESEYPRTVLSQITREINKLFLIPALIVFKTGDNLTLSIINRRQHKRDESRDVLEKVTLIKDINIIDTHRAHIDILFDLSLEQLRTKNRIDSFSDLHNAWQRVLDTKELNKKFYKELSEWYFWAMGEVYFPNKKSSNVMKLTRGQWKSHPEIRETNATHLIRLLTRILFVWFIKEKGLIREEFFQESTLKNLLKGFDKNDKDSIYYKAILQNLFFATLNQEISKRKFRTPGYKGRGIANQWRYKRFFADKNHFIELTETIPFLNGGLFECLDRFEYKTVNGVEREDKILSERIDWFSDEEGNELEVPNEIFFIERIVADLSEELGVKAKNTTVRGLFHILNSYKFTIAENTPIEEDVALDPELLGNVFENLLASYNPETKSTARKQTGSYYTPKEIVNYMVDESLKLHLKQALKTKTGLSEADINTGLDILFTYTERNHCFVDAEREILIEAIDSCKILDPACGSGAFPMGIIQKLVFILGKLDPDNRMWMERQKQEINGISDPVQYEKAVADIEEAFWHNELDYGRKLFLIKNCVYGVDIQPIAIQISKLRFLISLMIDQKVDFSKPEENFKIRALPNLETKFVAANALIGLPGQAAQRSFFENPAVEKLQRQIESIRNKMFSARTIEVKKKHRQETKILQEQLKQALLKGGENQEAAEMIADWDPYDQNVSSPFFDSAWMFGVKDGFDIVIGNPPYVDSENMVMNMPEMRVNYSSQYRVAKGNWDLFVLFIELGNLLSSSKSGCAYIVPNKLIAADYANETRKMMTEMVIKEIRDYSDVKVFTESAVYPITFITYNDNKCDSVQMLKMKSISEIAWNNRIQYNDFVASDNWDSYFSKNTDSVTIIGKMCKHTMLDNLAKVKGAATVSEAYELKKILTDEMKYDATFFKFINTGTIDRYTSLWHNSKTQYIKRGYFCPIVLKDDLHSLYPKRYVDASAVKIIIGGMTKILECYFDTGEYLAGKSTVLVLEDAINLKYLIGLLNSKLLTFFYRTYFSSLSLAGGFLRIGAPQIKRLPIAIGDDKASSQIIELVTKICIEKQTDTTADTNALETEIDRLVYELYSLTEDEIKIVEDEGGQFNGA